jgi:hypothetical protein
MHVEIPTSHAFALVRHCPNPNCNWRQSHGGHFPDATLCTNCERGAVVETFATWDALRAYVESIRPDAP